MDQLVEFVVHHPFLWGALGLIVIAFLVNEAWRNASGAAPIPPSQAIRLINGEDAVVVDTRSKADYKKNHIINARHVPLAGIDSRTQEISRDTAHPVIVYDAAGTSAGQAVTKLKAKGFTRVHALKGGFNGWQADGLPVTRK
ncbi:rhodanese-like domain-containing protein [Salinisphaera sp. Q1T1-3]|uniref:rhodanese-like domain-containing protein n=1 Tax=Salinisphaera sp. Q1T1-3 TaxID=2321229 RepID=UPI000E77047F|nr:rhodanese-like domain-containing protein [Salinisphaera sp. Q1T1-3]RJS91593.1 rhodanese-like domain-containing protein [Salinisphaera sp. Q1T1-3]